MPAAASKRCDRLPAGTKRTQPATIPYGQRSANWRSHSRTTSLPDHICRSNRRRRSAQSSTPSKDPCELRRRAKFRRDGRHDVIPIIDILIRPHGCGPRPHQIDGGTRLFCQPSGLGEDFVNVSIQILRSRSLASRSPETRRSSRSEGPAMCLNMIQRPTLLMSSSTSTQPKAGIPLSAQLQSSPGRQFSRCTGSMAAALLTALPAGMKHWSGQLRRCFGPTMSRKKRADKSGGAKGKPSSQLPGVFRHGTRPPDAERSPPRRPHPR